MGKYLAIIPARLGSKRIPKKNIKNFRGKPIIAWSIEAAKTAGIFDTIMVSTDSTEISDIAIQYGADIPFFRSDKCSDDFATITDVLTEVISQYEASGMSFEAACCIYATAPFVTRQHLMEGLTLLTKSEHTAVFPVTPFGYPIERAFVRDKLGNIKFKNPDFVNARSQDIPTAYHDAGMWIWFKPDCLKVADKLFSGKTGSIVVPESHAHDIDTMVDWEIATLKHQLLFPKLN